MAKVSLSLESGLFTAEQLEEMLLAQKGVIVLLSEDIEAHTKIEEE